MKITLLLVEIFSKSEKHKKAYFFCYALLSAPDRWGCAFDGKSALKAQIRSQKESLHLYLSDMGNNLLISHLNSYSIMYEYFWKYLFMWICSYPTLRIIVTQVWQANKSLKNKKLATEDGIVSRRQPFTELGTNQRGNKY